jgi:hypothetical protein
VLTAQASVPRGTMVHLQSLTLDLSHRLLVAQREIHTLRT